MKGSKKCERRRKIERKEGKRESEENMKQNNEIKRRKIQENSNSTRKRTPSNTC